MNKILKTITVLSFLFQCNLNAMSREISDKEIQEALAAEKEAEKALEQAEIYRKQAAFALQLAEWKYVRQRLQDRTSKEKLQREQESKNS